MYQPPHHREDRLEVQQQLITSSPFGLLISTGREGLLANGVPFILDPVRGPFGTLQAHVAKANEQWKGLNGQQVLVIFQGSQNYISPSYYETKRATGKVVPTWNYIMVQARGQASVHDDAQWLARQIEVLTNQHESSRERPWAVSDAPHDYMQSQMKGIVGIEIEINALEGKWKVSQNRPEADRRGVAEGLAHANPAMSDIVKLYGKI